jgi:hypothetical protein
MAANPYNSNTPSYPSTSNPYAGSTGNIPTSYGAPATGSPSYGTPAGSTAPSYVSPQQGYYGSPSGNPARPAATSSAPAYNSGAACGPNGCTLPPSGSTAASSNSTNPVRRASPYDTDDRYGTGASAGSWGNASSTPSYGSGGPIATTADLRSGVGGSASLGGASGATTTPAYRSPATQAVPPTTPAASADADPNNPPPYRPGSTGSSGDWAPRTPISAGAAPASLSGSPTGSSGVMPTSYTTPADLK